VCLGASSIFVEKKMNWAKDNQRKKEAGNIFVLPAITTRETSTRPKFLHHYLLKKIVRQSCNYEGL
jgi:hypothetical protein